MIKIWECILWCLATGHPEILSLRHFSFSAPSVHRCALCLPIDLITKVDFNWIAGKAHKIRTEVIKKKLGWTKRGRQKRWKRRIAGWKRSIAGNSQFAGTTFQTKAYLPRKKSFISIDYFKATEQRISGIFLPSKYFLPARKDIAEMVATTTQGLSGGFMVRAAGIYSCGVFTCLIW